MLTDLDRLMTGLVMLSMMRRRESEPLLPCEPAVNSATWPTRALIFTGSNGWKVIPRFFVLMEPEPYTYNAKHINKHIFPHSVLLSAGPSVGNTHGIVRKYDFFLHWLLCDFEKIKNIERLDNFDPCQERYVRSITTGLLLKGEAVLWKALGILIAKLGFSLNISEVKVRPVLILFSYEGKCFDRACKWNFSPF